MSNMSHAHTLTRALLLCFSAGSAALLQRFGGFGSTPTSAAAFSRVIPAALASSDNRGSSSDGGVFSRVYARAKKADRAKASASRSLEQDSEEAEEDIELLCRLPRVSIEYCTQCNWMLRSAWLSQELLTTFNGTLREVALQPNHEGGGVFIVSVADEEGELVIWDRSEEERFPEAKELKQRVRDSIDPGRSLGHSDEKSAEISSSPARFAVQRLLGLLDLSSRPRRRRGE
uniref:Selenoprotein O n=1 Tax=Coccolithus braarudii TaxID=221442 RepID=A0A7S0Q2A8_9EUKA